MSTVLRMHGRCVIERDKKSSIQSQKKKHYVELNRNRFVCLTVVIWSEIYVFALHMPFRNDTGTDKKIYVVIYKSVCGHANCS